MTLHIEGVHGLRARSQTQLGISPWVDVRQAEVTTFGIVTRDLNAIHVDPEFATASGFAGTIAHGFFSLSLIGGLLGEVFVVDDVSAVLNYGINRARFPEPLTIPSRVRLSVRLGEVYGDDAAVDAQFTCVVSAEDLSRPVCAAEVVLRYIQ
jgi:acyl dehydratase